LTYFHCSVFFIIYDVHLSQLDRLALAVSITLFILTIIFEFRHNIVARTDRTRYCKRGGILVPYCLPDKYTSSHEYCFYSHDVIASFIGFLEKNKLISTTYEFDDAAKMEEFAKVGKENAFDWLEDQGYQKELSEFVMKNIFIALIADFCHFTYEALRCSEKGKIAVTYCLLRKPLKENLFYLEWMLAYPEEFINRFMHQEAEEYVIDKVNPHQKKEIIRKASEVSETSNINVDGFLYELRYDKASDLGYESLWNKATHLVTTFKHIRTEDQNLNFVFARTTEIASLWEYMYRTLPLLLYHAAGTVSSLAERIFGFDEEVKHYNRLFRDLKFLAYNSSRLDDESHLALYEGLPLFCSSCREPRTLELADIKSFAGSSSWTCQKCGKVNKISSYCFSIGEGFSLIEPCDFS